MKKYLKAKVLTDSDLLIKQEMHCKIYMNRLE